MHTFSLFDTSIHPTIVHDGVRIFSANILAQVLFHYPDEETMLAAGINGIIAPESQWLSIKRIEQLRQAPEEDLPDAEMVFVRCDGTVFQALTHTHSLRWAFDEPMLEEIKKKAGTDIVFYSWVENIRNLK